MHVYTNPGTDTWTQVYDYPGAATCGVASAMWPAGASGPYAQLFDPTAAGSTQQLSFGASGWTPFADFGGQGLTQLSTVVGLDGHVEVYGLAPDGSMRANAWNLTTGAWSGWQPLGGTKLVTGAAPIVWNDGHIALFALDGQGAAWTDSETAGTWSGWTSMGGQLASRPVPARWADGHVEVFARGLDGHTWSSSWSTGWQPFTSIESTTALSGQLSVLVNPGGAGAAAGPELFGRLASGQVGHLTWSGTAWTTWAPLGDQQAASDPQAWIRADDTGQVFAVDPGGNLVQDHRDATGAWKGWATIATGIAPCVETLTIVADAGADGAAPADAATPDGAAADGGGGTAPATAGKGSSGGCSCRSAGQVPAAGGAGGGVVALLLMLAVWGRRRHPPGHVLAGRSKSRHADDRHP
jgi:MYXO-CTERM domain-containing protein